MRALLGAVALVAAASTAPAADLPTDIFERDRAIEAGEGFERLRTDLQLGRAGAGARLEAWLRRTTSVRQDHRLAGYKLLCGAYFREQRFAEGIRACASADRIQPGTSGNMLDLHRSYAKAGPLRWSRRSVAITLREGQATMVRRKGVTVEALVDTGAEVAVVSESIARSLGARVLDTVIEVGTTTTPVKGRLATIDALQVGDATLRNLTALLLTDEQAAYSGLKLVIPLQALIANGRFAYLDHGRALVLGARRPWDNAAGCLRRII